MHLQSICTYKHGCTKYEYSIGFDLCKLADQALKRRYFDASVVFYDLCATKRKQDELLNKKVIGIFKKTHISSITSKKSASLLKKAIGAHDHAFQHLGQLGPNHRCNDKPFHSKSRKTTIQLSHEGNSQLSLNETDLWYYKTSTPIKEPIIFGNTEAKLADKLCRGGKIKVYVHKKNAVEIIVNSCQGNILTKNTK